METFSNHFPDIFSGQTKICEMTTLRQGGGMTRITTVEIVCYPEQIRSAFARYIRLIPKICATF